MRELSYQRRMILSKIFERIIHKQITSYMTDKLAHSITGFRKSQGTQTCLVVMLENWKREKLFKESETKGED